MKTHSLTTQELVLSSIGLGCMGMYEFYGSHNESQFFNTLSQAIESEVRFWDTSNIYGPKTDQELLGLNFAKHPEQRNKIALAIKFGIMRNSKGNS